MLPFFGPEITPRHDFTGPVLQGSPDFESGAEPGLQVRALLEGQFLNMRLHSQWMEVKTERIRLTGGASKNDGIAQLVADVFQAPVERLDVSNSAALGAALIAAAADGHDLAGASGNLLPGLPGLRAPAGPRARPTSIRMRSSRFQSLLAAASAADELDV